MPCVLLQYFLGCVTSRRGTMEGPQVCLVACGNRATFAAVWSLGSPAGMGLVSPQFPLGVEFLRLRLVPARRLVSADHWVAAWRE